MLPDYRNADRSIIAGMSFFADSRRRAIALQGADCFWSCRIWRAPGIHTSTSVFSIRIFGETLVFYRLTVVVFLLLLVLLMLLLRNILKLYADQAAARWARGCARGCAGRGADRAGPAVFMFLFSFQLMNVDRQWFSPNTSEFTRGLDRVVLELAQY